MTIEIEIKNLENEESGHPAFVAHPGQPDVKLLPGQEMRTCIYGERSVHIHDGSRCEPTVKKTCDHLRGLLKGIEGELRALRNLPDMPDPKVEGGEKFPGQLGEMLAQSMLAVRHVEDARMRIGKTLQYAGDGVSILDKREE